METSDVQGDALGDYLFLTAGAHKEEVFLTVIVEPELAFVGFRHLDPAVPQICELLFANSH